MSRDDFSVRRRSSRVRQPTDFYTPEFFSRRNTPTSQTEASLNESSIVHVVREVRNTLQKNNGYWLPIKHLVRVVIIWYHPSIRANARGERNMRLIRQVLRRVAELLGDEVVVKPQGWRLTAACSVCQEVGVGCLCPMLDCKCEESEECYCCGHFCDNANHVCATSCDFCATSTPSVRNRALLIDTPPIPADCRHVVDTLRTELNPPHLRRRWVSLETVIPPASCYGDAVLWFGTFIDAEAVDDEATVGLLAKYHTRTDTWEVRYNTEDD